MLLPFVSKVAPPLRKLMVRVEGSKTPPNFKVPPAKTRPPVAPPIWSNASICSTPSLIVVRRAPPPAVLATESTKVPRPDLVMSAEDVSAEVIVAVSVFEVLAESGLTTWITYSGAAPAVTIPSPKPPSVMP